ncbi:MAG: hypothetical protein O3B08_19795 [Proteobacteria bacterium]|nr:hypothetical protein [Pseudomonadota bacterium]
MNPAGGQPVRLGQQRPANAETDVADADDVARTGAEAGKDLRLDKGAGQAVPVGKKRFRQCPVGKAQRSVQGVGIVNRLQFDGRPHLAHGRGGAQFDDT